MELISSRLSIDTRVAYRLVYDTLPVVKIAKSSEGVCVSLFIYFVPVMLVLLVYSELARGRG